MQLIALDPGHFHASLVQQEQYPGVDSAIKVLAPEGKEVEQYLQQVTAYNRRDDLKVHWTTEVHLGPGFLEKLGTCAPGSIVILAGNNRLKPAYIQAATHAGMHVLADKPMAIDAVGFESLKEAFATAEKNHTLLYDIMSERFEIRNILQKAISQTKIFGELQKGSISSPAVVKESVHHFKKTVAGKPLIRPIWYMDTREQGEGITDVTTHLVDLVQWTCFPEQVLDYRKDIHIESASAWPTALNLQQFAAVTGAGEFTPSLKDLVGADNKLNVYANGAFSYTIKGVHAHVAVQWKYEALAGTGDTHYSLLKGTKASLMILQNKEQNYQPTLYIQPVSNTAEYIAEMKKEFGKLEQQYPGISLKQHNERREVIIPASLKKGHELLFAKVTKQFLKYLAEGRMPEWEIAAMLSKYYTTTQALAVAARLEKD